MLSQQDHRRTALVRNGALTGYSALVQKLGGQPRPLLEHCHIPADVEQQHDAYLPYRSVIQLLEFSAARLGCPDFGMRLSMAQDIDILGPLAIVIQYSSTFREAVDQITRYLHVFNPGQR